MPGKGTRNFKCNYDSKFEKVKTILSLVGTIFVGIITALGAVWAVNTQVTSEKTTVGLVWECKWVYAQKMRTTLYVSNNGLTEAKQVRIDVKSNGHIKGTPTVEPIRWGQAFGRIVVTRNQFYLPPLNMHPGDLVTIAFDLETDTDYSSDEASIFCMREPYRVGCENCVPVASVPMPTVLGFPSPMPTYTPTPTCTPTPTATPTVEMPTATPTPPMPTPTPISVLKYPMPDLWGPPDWQEFRGRDAQIDLTWSPVPTGVLAEGEWYGLSVRYIGVDGQIAYRASRWLKEPQWRFPREYYDQINLSERSVWWDVRVVRQSTNPDGSAGGIDISPISETRVFFWR